MSDYFVLHVDFFVEPPTGLTRVPTPQEGFEPSRWMQGRMFGSPPDKVIEVETYRSAGGISEIFLDSIPIFREDVLEVLEKAGVTNFQTFPARLTYTEQGSIFENYKAVNIIGCIAAADLARSDYTPAHAPAFRTAFRKLMIDPEKAKGQLMFRLLESVSKVIIHARVRDALAREPFRYLRYIPA